MTDKEKYIANILNNQKYQGFDNAVELVRNKLDEDDSDLILWHQVPEEVRKFLEKYKSNKPLTEKEKYIANVLFKTNFRSYAHAVELVRDKLDEDESDVILWHQVPEEVENFLDKIDAEKIFSPENALIIPGGIVKLLNKLDNGEGKVALYEKAYSEIEKITERAKGVRFHGFPKNSGELFYAIDLHIEKKIQDAELVKIYGKRERKKKKETQEDEQEN